MVEKSKEKELERAMKVKIDEILCEALYLKALKAIELEMKMKMKMRIEVKKMENFKFGFAKFSIEIEIRIQMRILARKKELIFK